LMNSVPTIFTSSTSPFKNRSRAKLAIGRASAYRGESVKVNSATNCRWVCATNCDARLPAVMNTVVGGRKLAAHGNKMGLRGPAQSFVSADEDHGALSNFAHLQQRMGELAGVFGGVPLDAIHQSREGPRHQRVLLRLEHFRRCHHLHRTSDLRSAGNRPDASAKFTRAWHISLNLR